MTATLIVTNRLHHGNVRAKSAKQEEQVMYERAILALAFGAALTFTGPSLACDKHQSHANLTTAATQPAPLPPVAAPQADVQAPQLSPVVSEEPAAAMTKRYQSGYSGCPQMRTKDQTVYLTN
jgi:hypothetical protein